MNIDSKFTLFKNITSKYYDVDPEKLDYNDICNDAVVISGASYAIINLVSRDKKFTQTIGISGLNKHLKKAAKIFGYDLIGKKWDVDDFAIAAMNNKKIINQGDIEVASSHIKKSVAAVLKSIFGIGNVYSVGLFSQDKVVGTLVLVMPKNKLIEDAECVELFAQQISSILYRSESRKIINDAYEKTRIVTEYSPDVLTVINKNYEITYVNRLREGFRREEVIGRNVLNFVPSLYQKKYKEWLDEVFENGNKKEEEIVTFDANKQERFYSVNFIPINSNNGIEFVYIASRDITDEKEKADLIQNQKVFLEEATKIAKIGTWEFNVINQIFIASEETCKIAGVADPKDFTVEQIVNLYSQKDLPIMRAALRKAITTGEGYDLEFLVDTFDGRKKWVRSIARVKSENGVPVELRGIVQDTTEYHNNILEQQRTVNQLAQFQNALNTASIISKTDINGIITFVNSNFLKTSKFQARELLGKKHSTLNSNYQSDAFWKQFWEHIIEGLIWKGEIKNKAKTGEYYWVDTTVIPLYDDKGAITEFLSISHDITERKKTESELSILKTQIDDIINNIDSAMWSMDMEGNYLFMNTATEHLTGYKAEEFYSDKNFWKKLFSHEKQKMIESSKFELLKKGVTEREQQIITKNGEIKCVFTKRKLFRDKNGRPFRIDAISTDITERKKNEEELRLSKQKLDSIFNEMDDVIWSINLPDYKTLFLTSSVEKLYGISYEDFINDNKYWERAIYIEDKLIVKKIHKDIEQQGFYQEDYRITTASGKIKWVRNKGKVIKDGDGKSIRIDWHITDISESKFAEQILKESEKSLREAENLAKMGRWELDLLQNKLIWSESMFGMWEKENKVENATYENFLDSIHPDDRDKVNEAYIGSLRKKLPYTIEHRLLMPDGRIKWVKESCKTIYNADGIPIKSIGITQDVTERKLSELELINLKENLELTSKIAGIGGWEVNLVTNDLTWTQVTKEIYEVDVDYQPDVESAIRFFIPEHQMILREAFDNAVNNKLSYNLELEMITAKGNRKWVEAKGEPELIKNRTQRIHGTIRDISLKKRSEIIISKQNQFQKILTEISTKLVKSTVHTIGNTINKALELFGKYTNSDRAFIFQIDENGETITNTYNWELREMKLINRIENAELKPYKWLAKQLQKQSVFVIEDVNKLTTEAAYEKLRFGAIGIKSILFVRLEVNDKTYGIFGIASKYSKKKYSKESIIETQVVSNIISDALIKNQLELKSQIAKEEAELANKSKTEFLANMSHEIRTPMNAVLGFSELLKGKTISPKYENYVNGILTGGKSLLGLINDILDLSKIEAGKMEIRKEPVNIDLLLKEVHSIFRETAKEKELYFNCFIEPTTPSVVLLDEVRLRQIIFNIIGNAMKFTIKGGVSIRVAAIPEVNNKNIKMQFQISDTGIGIPQEQHQAIFEPFKQMDGQSTRMYGGTGLGLAITKRLVNIMNGEIILKSEINQGTIVTITINDVEKLNTIKEVEIKSESSTKYKFNNQTILLVEDISSNREVIKGMLDQCNLNIIEVKNGKEAIEQIEKSVPDLILMDIMMPIMDGNEAIQIIKSNNNYKNIPLIALTAATFNDSESRSIHLCDDFVRKPINRTKLISVLRYFLAHSSMSTNYNQPEGSGNNKILWKLELPKSIKYELMNRWDEVSELMSNDDVEVFAVESQGIAETYHDKLLLEYSCDLLEAARSFDYEKMKTLFNKFIY